LISCHEFEEDEAEKGREGGSRLVFILVFLDVKSLNADDISSTSLKTYPDNISQAVFEFRLYIWVARPSWSDEQLLKPTTLARPLLGPEVADLRSNPTSKKT
jgi:hypothetical protein